MWLRHRGLSRALIDLGRIVPPTFAHVAANPYPDVGEFYAHAGQIYSNAWRVYRYSDETMACAVSFSWAMSCAKWRTYDPHALWRSTGSCSTTLQTTWERLKTHGHWYRHTGRTPNEPTPGPESCRWATRVDQVRHAIQSGTPVVLGINWYSRFEEPRYMVFGRLSGLYLPRPEVGLGTILGTTAVCTHRVDDARQAVSVNKSTGKRGSLLWMPFATLERLLHEDGEAAVINWKRHV